MLNVDYDYYTSVGGRELNQDSVNVTKKNNHYLLVVADGLGGYRGGEVASQIVVDVTSQAFVHPHLPFDAQKTINEANEQILKRQINENKEMKSTVALVWLNEHFVECCHVGDSRIYLFKDGNIIYQSIDHSASQLAVYAHEITSDEIRNHCDRNILTRALGVDTLMKCEIQRFSIDDFDTCLICSDGFWEYILEVEMQQLLKESKDIHEWLWKMRTLHKERATMHHDNHSAIVLELRR